MAIGIIILLVGVPLGLIMLFKPREVWRASEGWKFRDPDANEPSDVSYALNGLGVLGGSLVCAVIFFATSSMDTSAATSSTSATRVSYPSYTYTPPPKPPFTAPPPQDRGALPMIGYTTTDGVATVYYYAPMAASAAPPPDRPRPCDVAPRIEGTGTEHVVVNVDLTWAPTVEADVAGNYQCRAENTSDPLVARSLVIGPISPTAELITSKPLPNMRLPRLAEPPRPLADPPAS